MFSFFLSFFPSYCCFSEFAYQFSLIFFLPNQFKNLIYYLDLIISRFKFGTLGQVPSKQTKFDKIFFLTEFSKN